MKKEVHARIRCAIAAAHALAGRVHTAEERNEVYYRLAADIVRLNTPRSMRRIPLANEVLQRQQRATWARKETVHDVRED